MAKATAPIPAGVYAFRDALIANLADEKAPTLIPRQQAVLLTPLTLPGPLSVVDVAAFLKTSKPAITRALDHLVSLEFVKRNVSKDDARKIVIEVLPGGHAYAKRIGKRLEAALKAAETALPKAA